MTATLDPSIAYAMPIHVTTRAKPGGEHVAKREKKSGGRPGLPAHVSARVRSAIEGLLSKEPYSGHGGVTRLAEAIGITQPALTQIRQGGGVSNETAAAVAKIAALDPAELGGAVVGVMVSGRFPNLELCLSYYAHRRPRLWSDATIAAARRDVWSDDVDPEAWRDRLDGLEATLARLPGSAISRGKSVGES